VVPRAALAARLAAAGFIAADEEAVELEERAGGDAELLDRLVARRVTGEPLAWITGRVEFCGVEVRVDPGVYVPRPHTELLARRAAALLPAEGVAIDLCCGSGAIARVLPGARVVGVDLDERAVACARANGVEAYRGDLFDAVPRELAGRVDVVVAVTPYVPDDELDLLQRDTFVFESELAYDGGADGLEISRRVAAESPRWLRAGGAVVLELGGAAQARALGGALERAGFTGLEVLRDEDGDERGIVGRTPGPI
jgi:release factor glutamine methyltransferase